MAQQYRSALSNKGGVIERCQSKLIDKANETRESSWTSGFLPNSALP